MEPIVLTEFDEKLLSVLTENEDTKLSGCIGIHENCNGRLDIIKVSETHKAVLCKRCKLRIVIPEQVDTYQKLRRYLKFKIREIKENKRLITKE